MTADATADRYKWTALSNTTLGIFMAALDSSIVIISLPAIFRGIHLNPLEPSNVGYLLYEETFGTRDHRLRLELDGLDVALVAVDASKPDVDEGEVGREHYGWVAEGFPEDADLRIFVCHHHLVPIPGTGRERNQVLDAGDVLSLLHESKVDLMLGGHRHVPYVWPIAGLYVVHSGTVSTLRTRGFGHPSYNMVRIGAAELEIERRIPGAAGDVLGVYPRRWPPELAAQPPDSFVRPRHGESLADT